MPCTLRIKLVCNLIQELQLVSELLRAGDAQVASLPPSYPSGPLTNVQVQQILATDPVTAWLK